MFSDKVPLIASESFSETGSSPLAPRQRQLLASIEANNIEQLSLLITRQPDVLLNIEIERQPLAIYLLSNHNYQALRCILEHCISHYVPLYNIGMSGVELLKFLFHPASPVSPDKLQLIEYCVSNIPLTAEEKANCPISEFGLKKEWDEQFSLRSAIYKRLRKEGEHGQCRVDDEPLLVYIAHHPDDYSQSTLEALVNRNVASEFSDINKSDIKALHSSTISIESETSNIVRPRPISPKSSTSVTSPKLSVAFTPSQPSRNIIQLTTEETIEKNKEEPIFVLDPPPLQHIRAPSFFSSAIRKVKSAYTDLEHWSEKKSSKLHSRFAHQRRPEDELGLIANRAAIAGNYIATPSELAKTAVPLTPLHALSDKEKAVTIKKLQLLRQHLQRTKDIKAEARDVLKHRVSVRKQIKATRINSPLTTSASPASAGVFKFGVIPASRSEWVTFDDDNTYPSSMSLGHNNLVTADAEEHTPSNLMSPTEQSETVKLWRKALSSTSSIPRPPLSSPSSLWNTTLRLAEQKLTQQHQELEAESQNTLIDVTITVKKALDSIRHEPESAFLEYAGIVDSLVNQLESYNAEESVENSSKAIFHSAALIAQFAKGKEVFKQWDLTTIQNITSSLSSVASVALNTTAAVSEGVGSFLPDNIQKVTSTVSGAANVIDHIQTSFQEVQHVTLEIVELIKQHSSMKESQDIDHEFVTYDFLTMMAGISKSLMSIIQKILLAAKEILAITNQALAGLSAAIPGLGIVINIIDIAQRSLYLANNAYYLAQLSEMKERDQDFFPDHPILCELITDGRTNYYTLKDIAYEGKVYPNISPDVIREARRYSMICELKKTCRKRVIRAANNVFFDAAAITGDALKLGGVTSGAGIGLSVGVALSKASLISIKWLKQSYHDHQNDLSSSSEKHLLRCRLIESLAQFLVAFLEQDLLDENMTKSYIEQYGELRVFFYGIGLKVNDFLGKKIDEKAVKKVYKALKSRS
ncbi:MAG: hypothetical protein HAW66_00090 [Shewanella sp.]|nr:hypothetical protein [Shewanella sp.]